MTILMLRITAGFFLFVAGAMIAGVGMEMAGRVPGYVGFPIFAIGGLFMIAGLYAAVVALAVHWLKGWGE